MSAGRLFKKKIFVPDGEPIEAEIDSTVSSLTRFKGELFIFERHLNGAARSRKPLLAGMIFNFPL
jgi:hypothetical protein